MGRQAPKKYSKMGYFEKQAFTKDQAKKHGIDLKYETVNGRHEQVDWEASNAAVAKAISNDYDTRRSIEAAQLSGNKKAKDLGKGINNIVDAVNAERFMAKTHVKRLDATGKYSSANDEGNVTNYWVNKDRDKLRASFATEDQATEADPDKSVLEDFNDPIEFEHSQKVKDAKNRVDKYSMSIGENNLFGKVNDPVPAKDDQADAADSFVNDYKKGVSAGSSLKENKSQNINNAIDALKVSSYRNQFM